jgi:anti-sigma factor RsiW
MTLRPAPDLDLGCQAFGHLASPFVDGELPRTERDAFATHLDTCGPCSRLCSEYRALDVAARAAVPRPTEAQWQAAWAGIHRAIEVDREELARAPLQFLVRWRRRQAGRPGARLVAPLGYAAAAVVLLGALLVLQDRMGGGALRPAVPDAAALHAEAPKVLSIACASPDYMPVVYTTRDAEPMTVIQCAYIGPNG